MPIKVMSYALVAELVDAQVSGTCGSTPVKVQVLFRAPIKTP